MNTLTKYQYTLIKINYVDVSNYHIYIKEIIDNIMSRPYKLSYMVLMVFHYFYISKTFIPPIQFIIGKKACIVQFTNITTRMILQIMDLFKFNRRFLSY